MTTYEVLCCFKSEKWYNYCNPLSSKYTWMPGNIAKTLDTTAVDSYLGRLVAVAQLVNQSWVDVTADTLEAYIQALQDVASASVLWARPWPKRTVGRVQEFLSYRLPAECLEPLVEVFKIELWTSEGQSTPLNHPQFLQALHTASTSQFAPVQAWFQLHPEALSETTRYKEEIE